MLGRGKPASSMQKTYDDCYLTCSTAVYFEGQNNEAEALRSWRNALDQIYYHNAYRMPTGWRPRSETEKALQESLRQMELQCKERVDLLEALRQSREEAAEAETQAKATASSTSIPLQESADQSNAGGLGGGSIPPVNYSDISRPTPPALPTRNKRPSYTSKHSSGTDVPTVRRSPLQTSSAFTPSSSSSMLAPQSSTGQRKGSRTPSPEKRGGMLRTLRAGGKERTSSSGKLSNATFRKPAAASKAATQAWSITQRNASVGSLEQANGHLDGPSSSATVWDPYTRTLVDPSNSSRPTAPTHTASAPPAALHPSNSRSSQEQPRPSQKHVRPPSPSDYFVQPSASNGSQTESQRPPYPDHSLLNPVQPSQTYASSSEHLGPPSPITSPRQRPNPTFTANTTKARKQSPVRRIEPVSLPSYRNEYLPAQPSKYKNPPNARPPKTFKDLENQVSSSMPAAISQTKPKVAPPIPRKAVGVVNAAKARQQLDDRNVSSGYSADEHSSGRENSTRVRRKKNTTVEEDAPAPIVESVTEHPEAPTEPQNELSEWDERVKNLLNNLPRGVDEAAAKQIFNEIVIQGDEVHWDDVAGLEIAKSALKETVVYPFLRPDLFMGLREPARGMLLFGPPGTGKTMLARAVATESKSTFFAISASSLTSKYLGESEKLVRALFAIAKALAPSIIFVDEIDSLLSARGGSSEHEATRRIKTEFLIQWSDLAKAAAGKETSEKDKERGDASRVLVLAATNLPWAIDEAARRRFVRRQYIPLPEDWVRKLQLTTLMAAQKHNISDEDLNELVYLTEGFSGSDITALAKDAAMGPLRSLGEKLLHMSPDDIRPIDVTDFKASLVNIRPSVSASGLKEFEDWAKEFGERVTTKPPIDPSASGVFCCQVYAPLAALNWWYTNATIEAVDQTVVTKYLRYNNTVVPTATVTITNSSVAGVTGTYNVQGDAAGTGPSFSGIPTAMNAPFEGGDNYDQTIVLTGTEIDFGYTTITSPTPFIEYGDVYVFSGTVNDAGRCMVTHTDTSDQPASTSITTYDVLSEAMSWFGGAVANPIGLIPEFIPETDFILSTPYVHVVSTKPGEFYTTAKATKLKDAFITWLAHDPVALSAVPKIMSCSPVSGGGAPNVHIRVSFLTTSSAVTSTTNAMFINKATTTSAFPASQPPPAGPISTTPSTIPTTEATQTPSKQLSGQPDQPSGQVSDQPNPSPSDPPTKVSQEPGSPSQGPSDSPTTTAISLNEPDGQPTLTSGASNRPVTQKSTAGSPAAPIQSTDEPVSIGDQHSAQVTPAGGQASNLPEPKPVDSQAATQETSTVDTIQKTAAVSGTSQTETSQAPPHVAIGGVTVSHVSNRYIVGSQTLAFGGSAIEVSGTIYSLQASGGTAEVNGQDVRVTTLASPIESAAPIVLGDSTGRPVTSGAYVVADQTLSRGGSAIEISGTTYSLEPSGDRVVVNGEATPISVLQATLVQPATVVVGDVTAAPESSGAYYVVAGQTLSPGASAIEISSVIYSLPKSGVNIVVNGATSYANAASTPAPVILGSVTAASFVGGGYIVSSQILSPGSTQVEITGTTYSLAASGNTIFVDGKPTAIRSAAPVTEATSLADAVNTPVPVTFGSVTAAPFIVGGYVLASQVLSAGGTAIEVSGTTYSLVTSGNTVFINGKPTTFQNVAVAAPLTIESQTFTAIAASAIPLVIASQTLAPGGPAITVSGTTYSLPPSVTDGIVVNGQTKSLAQASGIAVLSIDSQQLSFTPLESGIVVASQTLYPGEAVTVNGETLSLASSGNVVVVNSGESTTTEGLGDYIWQGIATSTSASKTGSASRSTGTSGSITTDGSESSASSTARSSAAGAGTGRETTAATTTASKSDGINAGIRSWLSVITYIVMALLFVW
ncbi:AAA-domain-containing protein, partial [Aureobasidium melanogenum]